MKRRDMEGEARDEEAGETTVKSELSCGQSRGEDMETDPGSAGRT